MNLFALPPFLPLQPLFPSFVLEALGTVVCQTVYPFVQLALLANVHCNESLVWFKASAVWYTTITKFSPHLLWDFPRLPQFQRFCGYYSTGPVLLKRLQVLEGVDVRTGQYLGYGPR